MTDISNTKELTSQLEAAQSRNNRLLRQINALDAEKADHKTFYRQALLTLTQVTSVKQKNPVYKPLIALKLLLQKDAAYDELKPAMQRLKNAALSDDAAEPKDILKPASFLGRMFKGHTEKAESDSIPQSGYIQLLKTVYQTFVDELRLTLPEKEPDAFSDINRHIRHSDTPEELEMARDKILSLIKGFTDNVVSERELTAEFIKDITTRLFEIEGQIFQSIAHTNGILSADGDFNTQLQEHINELKTSVDFSKTLDDLKSAVMGRLDTINDAIETKTTHDKKFKGESDRHISTIRHDLERMKKNILSAKEHSKYLEEELLKDPLTGAFNRRAYDRQIRREFNRYLRYGTVFSVILFDVDHFKVINDAYGHAVGDKCLLEIISRVKPVLRETDFLSRYGGEEFIVLLPETDSSSAANVAEKLRKVVENIEFLHRKQAVKITISLGVTEASPGDTKHQELSQRMDKAMYAAKKAGRNRVEVQ